MSLAHVKEIIEVSNVIEANRLIKERHELLQIVPGWDVDNTPCTLFYLSKPDEEDKADKLNSDWTAGAMGA